MLGGASLLLLLAVEAQVGQPRNAGVGFTTHRRSLQTIDCTPPDSFIQIRLDSAQVVRSNLGGQGGQCEPWYIADLGGCVETYCTGFSGSESAAQLACVEQHHSTTPHEI